jgi:hypothetical protein
MTNLDSAARDVELDSTAYDVVNEQGLTGKAIL